MNISHYPVDSNTAILVAIQGKNQSQYLQPDYFLSSSNNSFLGKKYDKIQQRISRIVSAMLLSGLVLTTSVDASASSNTEVPVFPYMQDQANGFDHEESQLPDLSSDIFQSPAKKKSLVRRAAHKVAKRLGFSNSTLKSKVPDPIFFEQPSMSYDEVKAIYESEYGESIDDAMSKRVERNETLADILRRTLDIRERELVKRESLNTLDTFSDTASVTSSSGISEMSISDSNSDNSGSTSDEHIWQDPDKEIGEVLIEELGSDNEPIKNIKVPEVNNSNPSSYSPESTLKYLDEILDTSSRYSGSDTASNSDISSPDAGSMNGSFDFTPSSDDLDHTDTTQHEFSNIPDTILTEIPNETFATSHNAQNWEWDTDWDDSSDDDTSSIYTSQSEYSDSDSEYPNSDSEYDFSSEQVSSNEFEVIEEGGNFDTAVTRTQETASVTIDVSDVSNELQVSAISANITDESEVSAPVDQANTENHNTLLAVADTELAISDTTNDLANADLGIALDIESTLENLWFIMDELPALGKINSLNTALAESRKYGGCFVAGIQNIFQLDKIYGSAATNDLLDLFNSKFIFRVGDQQTAHRSAMMLGEQEIRKTQESLSYGSNTIRDGVNINTIEQKKMQVLPAEIMSLPNLSCFVKLAGHYPISKLNMKWQN